MSPRVSVFIASYNAPQFVALACQSILDQTFSDLELVVVDDGSGEPTLAVLRDLVRRDSRMRLVEAEHRGQIETLNHAISLCRGEYIARLDHDDVAHPHRIELQADYLDAHPDLVAVGSHVGKIDIDGRRLPPPRYRTGYSRSDLSGRRPRLVFLMGPTLMARAGALKRLNGFRPEFAAAEDRDISWRLAALGATANLPVALVDHRGHAGSLSSTAQKTQTFARLMSDLSALAAHFGKDDSQALALIDVGNDYLAAIKTYENLLSDVYPVRTFVLLELAKPRFLKLKTTYPSAPLSRQIIDHVFGRPWDVLKLKLLMQLPRVALYEARAT